MLKKALHYYDKQYKKLMFFSFLILILSVVVVGVHYAKTGEFFDQGVSLKGGLTLTIPIQQHYEVDKLQNSLIATLSGYDVTVREITEAGRPKALIVETDAPEAEMIAALSQHGVPLEEGKYNLESMGSALGQNFYRQTIIATFLAFIAMAIVVFITFRKLIPSLFVILAAFSDIISTLAVINILGVKLTTAGIASFLMLIGYSVDTDILLTTRVLKRKGEGGSTFERIVKAMKTGLTMSLTSFGAALVGYFFAQSDIIKQIMLIIAIGLLFDIIYTWLQNAGILRWYLEKNER